jgi:hypothetical protein
VQAIKPAARVLILASWFYCLAALARVGVSGFMSAASPTLAGALAGPGISGICALPATGISFEAPGGGVVADFIFSSAWLATAPSPTAMTAATIASLI